MDGATWDTIVPVIVGGLIGIAGSVVGPWFIERRRQKAEHKKVRAEKFEELVAALYEHRNWLHKMERIWVLGKDDEQRSATSIMKAQAIATIYFSQFREAIRELDQAADEYQMWMFEAGKRTEIQGTSMLEGVAEAYKPYIRQFNILINQLNHHAHREFR